VSDGFFVVDLPSDLTPGVVVEVTGSEAHHMAVVRRLAVGENVTLTNGQGHGVHGVVSEASKSRVKVEVAESFVAAPDQPVVTVFQALPKQDRGELAVDLMTEAGVSDITPWRAARSQVSWSGERGLKAHDKWVQAAREASKQARRFWVPNVSDALSPGDVVAASGESDVLIIMHEKATTPIFQAVIPSQGRVGIIIGPEGGLTDEEVAGFEAVGGKTYSMGSTVLRTSTAGAIAVTQVRLLAHLRAQDQDGEGR
jgi:16S rRNA (uracil1498-N3)-methyltransferase